MPLPEHEAYDIARAAKAADPAIDDFALFKAEYEQRLAERRHRLERDAMASWRAMDGWARVQSEDDWLTMVRQADEALDDGSFLIERLGAERYLDPALMAVLLALRRRLIDEHGATTAAELMMVDLAVLSYHHTIKINGWIGDFARWLEAEFFGKEGLSVARRDGYRRPDASGEGTIRGLTVEEIVERLAEKLMPLLDRSNRMMLRNLKALQARRQTPTPTVSIGSAGQVNVAAAQENVARGEL